ncbi:YczE/YyaS/YitT family protein [Cellulomonas denverensis]|uniref:Membrane protein YczE n=1 Tax=Cellulomonas denverensis TaxID=264297 RepID=A0A7X6KW72_9CELL|nr:hypothetical protein [Cellulomonas denverensis]NKY23250.1 hypothetical protein [Cellulomonas denverensis]GIG26368.1 membrane protein [Cellulomonas denverensis]
MTESRRLGRRLPQLFLGLVLYALSIAMVVHPALGSMPWDVLSQGLARQLHWSLGTAVLVSSVVVLLCWIPLRQRPGFGTVANVLVIGLMTDPFVALLDRLPTDLPLVARAGIMVAGIGLNGLAGALYIGSRLGPGPRDGLMTGLVARTGGRVALIRGGIELTVVLIGWALGGTVGVGTVLYAVAIGPILGWLMPRFAVPLPGDTEPAGQEAAQGRQGEAPAEVAPA